MEQLLRLNNIQWVVKYPQTHKEDQSCPDSENLTRYLVKSSCPFLHLLRLERKVIQESSTENHLHVERLIQSLGADVHCQVIGKGDCSLLYLATSDGHLWCLPLASQESNDGASRGMEWMDDSQQSGDKQPSKEPNISFSEDHLILHIPSKKLDSFLVLPTAVISVGRDDGCWLIQVFEKDSLHQNRNTHRNFPALSFTVMDFAQDTAKKLPGDQQIKPLMYCVHTTEMNFMKLEENDRCISVDSHLFRGLFGEETLLYQIPVVILAFYSGHIIWFPLRKTLSAHTQHWQMLVDITDAPVSVQYVKTSNQTSDKDDNREDKDQRINSLMMLGKSGKATSLMLSEKGQLTHEEFHFTGPVVCSVMISQTKLVYSTGKEIVCVQFDKDMEKNQWMTTRWKYAGLTHLCHTSQPETRLPLAPLQLFAATYRGVLVTLSLDQSEQRSGGATSGQQLKDLLTSIVSTSESMTAAKENLRKKEGTLEQLSLAAHMCAGISDKPPQKGRKSKVGKAQIPCQAPFAVQISVGINPCYKTLEEKYSVMVRITNQSALRCVGWNIVVSLRVMLQDDDATRRCPAVTVPLPELCQGQHAEINIPAGDLPILGLPIRVLPCLVLNCGLIHDNPMHPNEDLIKCAIPEAVYIPLPVTVLDIVHFMAPISNSPSISMVWNSEAKRIEESISSISLQRRLAVADADADTKCTAFSSPATSSLIICIDTGIQEQRMEEQLKQILVGWTLAPHWQEESVMLETPRGQHIQLMLVAMSHETVGEGKQWLVKIQAPQLKILLQTRLAIVDRLCQTSTFMPVSLLTKERDLCKLKEMQRHMEDLKDKDIEVNDLSSIRTDVVEVHHTLRQLPVSQAGLL